MRGVFILGLGLLLAGCLPRGAAGLGEESNPHYQLGLDFMRSRDYGRAIEAFEKVLEADPRSPLAHFRLGLLYEQHQKERGINFATAIHHYAKFLELQPDSADADNVRSRIIYCKIELAKSVSLPPGTQDMQRHIDTLKAENHDLKARLETLQAQLTMRTQPVNVAQAGPAPAPAETLPQPLHRPSDPAPARADTARSEAVRTADAAPSRVPASTRSSTYAFKRGDTLYSVARRHNLSVDALRAANPGLDPHNIPVGKVIRIP
ncbi:MAG TPA: LysM peptidoglycan-binding domain-containing protein [Methylomirabilota bacterium]|nr:LysM peptidoglycan-binding domain-containing protein [Methylomirabilota bacterium]